MNPPIQLISTDFDGTIFAEFENPPIPTNLVHLLARLQARGTKWIINTGRDLSSLMEALARANLPIQPDGLVLVEREIYFHESSRYTPLTEWNLRCTQRHRELFHRIAPDLPRLTKWINDRHTATVYQDAWSPLCILAGHNGEADAIHEYLLDYCRQIPHLTVVRNDVYARLAHDGYNKGLALAEIARRWQIPAENTFAAGDHMNDVAMLDRQHARWLATPANAVPEIKALIQRQQGYISPLSAGHGIADALEKILPPTE